MKQKKSSDWPYALIFLAIVSIGMFFVKDLIHIGPIPEKSPRHIVIQEYHIFYVGESVGKVSDENLEKSAKEYVSLILEGNYPISSGIISASMDDGSEVKVIYIRR